MAKNKGISNILHKNLKLEGFKVEDANAYFGITYNAGNIVYDKAGKSLYLLLVNTVPSDNIVKLLSTYEIALIGSSITDTNGMMLKVIYDRNNNGIVDAAEKIDDGVNSITATDILNHIYSSVGDVLNPHDINSRAKLDGNSSQGFKVKEAVLGSEAINLNQFKSVVGHIDGDYFLKGFWNPTLDVYPSNSLIPSQKGWYWITDTTGIFPSSGVVYNVGDYIAYTGVGNGDSNQSWVKIPVGVGGSGTNPTYNPNVPFTEQILHSHGGIPIGETAGGLDGKTMNQMFDDILFPVIQPKVGIAIRLAISNNPTSPNTLEVGTSIMSVFNGIFTKGSIIDGNGTTNPNSLVGDPITSGYSLFFNNILQSISNNSNITNTQIIAHGDNSWNMKCEYQQGLGQYFDSKGIPSDILDSIRIAGIIASSLITISGRYNIFFGSVPAPLTSQEVRLMNGKRLLNLNNTTNSVGVDYVIQPGETTLAFAVPHNSEPKVLYVESSNADVTNSFKTISAYGNDYLLDVEDANGVLTKYHIYTSTIAGYGQLATYKIILTV